MSPSRLPQDGSREFLPKKKPRSENNIDYLKFGTQKMHVFELTLFPMSQETTQLHIETLREKLISLLEFPSS